MQVEDFSNIIITTNSNNPVRVEPNDRRFCLINGSSERAGDSVYFDHLNEHMQRQDVAVHFYKYLMDFQLPAEHKELRVNRLPMTQDKEMAQ